MDKSTINATFKVKKSLVVHTENCFSEWFDLVSFRVLPDTEKLYGNDEHFQNIVNEIKKLQRMRDEYINEKNI